MKEKVNVTWKEEMAFEAGVNGHSIMLDATEKVGGRDRGPRPKPLTLVSLGGCTGMDVVSILNKMRVQFDAFNVEVEGEMTEEHPKYYKTITINYIFTGKDLPMAKLEKAVSLSQERYCGVTAMLSAKSEIVHNIIVNES